ncbi:MAG: pyruvate dehydrogenase [Planctomycetaceae bacterium]|nr:pyruvate dehydrogenase [Planctomycetaceae bacterium]
MGIEVKLPELGDGIESGDILDVLISEGDTISKEQSICEIETDKATVDVPSSHAGKVVKIHINAGDNVAIGATLITLEAVESESPAPEPTPSVAPSEPVASSEPVAPQPVTSEPVTSEPESVEPPAAPTQQAPAVVPEPTTTPLPTISDDQQTAAELAPAGPAIRRLAREVGVDLSKVIGTGASGRITRDDVLSIVRQASTTSQGSKTTVEPSAAASADTPTSEPTSTSEDDWGPIHVERMTKIRKTIARKMHESWTSAPRVTNFDDADVTELEAIRQASKADYTARGIKLTSMPFVIKAVALALKSNPTINAMIDEANDQIIYKKYVNIGIAVDTDRGLLVPSLRNADDLGISDMARALGTIADNARNNNFKLEDLRGSTFTISNLGAIGGTYSTPIINVPEVAILLLGRSRKLPVVVDDQVVVRLMMPLSLSYDHRLVDGAMAARFLNDVKSYLEQPSRLLIAP